MTTTLVCWAKSGVSKFVIFQDKAYTIERFILALCNRGEHRPLGASAIVLAGGFSSRFGRDKGLLDLCGKPLISYVLDAVTGIVDEKIVVVSNKEQLSRYSNVVLSKNARVIPDRTNIHSPLMGALTGFEEASLEYTLLLPCDTPFISRDILSLLLELCKGQNACIPRWPNGYVEPLQAAYRKEAALKASTAALAECLLNVQAMVDRLRCVRYVSTLVLKQVDAELRTFLNVNTPLDLKTAERTMDKQGPRRPGRYQEKRSC